MPQSPEFRITWLTGFSGSRDPELIILLLEIEPRQRLRETKILCLLSSFCSPRSHQGFSLNLKLSQLTVDTWICGLQQSTGQEKEKEQILWKKGTGLTNPQNPNYPYLYLDGWMDGYMHAQIDRFQRFPPTSINVTSGKRKFFLAQVYYLNKHLSTY